MVQTETAEEKQPSVSEKETPADNSHESLWGMVLLVGMLLGTVVIVTGIGYGMHRLWQTQKQNAAKQSIVSLPVTPQENTESNVSSSTAATAPASSEKMAVDSGTDAHSVQISVLNGGAAKGSAGVVAEMLKKAGYTKVTVGNAVADAVGVTVYYKTDLEKAAQAVGQSLFKTYPKAMLKPAQTSGDQGVAPVTVIVGK